jgi:hypothetical protein
MSNQLAQRDNKENARATRRVENMGRRRLL